MPQFDSSAFWGIAGIVVGIIVATFFFLIGKNKKILEYQITSFSLISKELSNIPSINVTFHEQPVKSLISTAIQFTNVGNQTIVSSDFASMDSLSVHIDHLYGYNVTADNKNLLPLIKSIDDNVIDIKFEFLKPNQSFTVKILHDGDVGVFGELKTGKIRAYRRPIAKLLLFGMMLLTIEFSLERVLYYVFNNYFVSILISSIIAVVIMFSALFFSIILPDTMRKR